MNLDHPKETQARWWATRVGLSQKERQTLEQGLVAYDFLDDPHWSASQALGVLKGLAKMSQPVRQAVVDLLLEPGVPVVSAIKVVANIGAMPKAEQLDFVRLYRSEDEHERSLALTRSVKNPPMPPEILPILDEAVRWLKKAEGQKHEAAPLVTEVLAKTIEVRDKVRADYQRFRAEEMSRFEPKEGNR